MPSRRALILMLLLVSMELTAGFAVIVGSSLLDAVSVQYAMYWLLLAAAVAGLIVATLLARYGPGDTWNRVLLLLGAAVGAGVPAYGASHNAVSFVVAIFLLLIAYSRGVSVAEEPATHAQVLRRFGIGYGLLFLGLIWVVARGIDSHRSIWEMLAFLGIGYTVLALVALGIARVERAREPGSAQAVVLAVAVQLVVIVLIGIGALQIFSYDIVGSVMGHTQPFWNALGATLYRFVTLLAGPIQGFLDLIRPHAHQRPSQPSGVNPAPTLGPNGGKLKQAPKSSPVAVIAALVVIGLILLGVLYGIWRALPRIERRKPARGFAEERRSLSPREMWVLLLSWLRRMFSRGTQAATEAVLAGRRRVLGDLPADPVRRVYAQMLRHAAAAGLRREEGTTPGELQLRLAAAWPSGAGDFGALTAAYVRRRYGEIEANEEEVARVQGQWLRLRAVMAQPRAGVSVVNSSAVAAVAPAEERRRRRWRISLPRLRLPEPAMGEQTPSFGRSTAVAIFSFVAPILIIIGLLALLAIISTTTGGHHGLGPLPAFSGIMNGIPESR